jgi:hypothetical protein
VLLQIQLKKLEEPEAGRSQRFYWSFNGWAFNGKYPIVNFRDVTALCEHSQSDATFPVLLESGHKVPGAIETWNPNAQID